MAFVNEDDEQSEKAPSENSESQQDDVISSEENEISQSQSQMTKSQPLGIFMEKAYDTLQDTFDETCETY